MSADGDARLEFVVASALAEAADATATVMSERLLAVIWK